MNLIDVHEGVRQLGVRVHVHESEVCEGVRV